MTKALILAAGQGQRLKPLTNDRPKGMVSVGGRTIMERQIELFRKLGISDISVVKGFCAESVPDYGVRHYLNPEYATTNMVYSLFCAAPELEGGPLIVSYGDILYSENVLKSLQQASGPVSVVVDMEWKRLFERRFDDPYTEAESLVVNDRGLIASIGQGQPERSDVQAQYVGLIRFDEEGLAAIRRLRDDVESGERPIGWGRQWRKSFMTDLLQELVRIGVPVRPVFIRGEWCEIDSLRDFELAEQIVPEFLP